MSLNLWIIFSSVVFLAFLWSVFAVRHFKHLAERVDEQWELVDEGLRKRQDLIPNLIETIKVYLSDKGEFISSLIEIRENARREYHPGAKKIEYEHDITDSINKAFALKGESAELARDTNFMELKREVDDLEQSIEDRVQKYNQMVRHYNKHRKIVPLLPVARVAGFKSKNIFEIEV